MADRDRAAFGTYVGALSMAEGCGAAGSAPAGSPAPDGCAAAAGSYVGELRCCAPSPVSCASGAVGSGVCPDGALAASSLGARRGAGRNVDGASGGTKFAMTGLWSESRKSTDV